ncbi:MBL fold metallo-hydrolase [Rubricoccus marinus]|uniref:Metallo-beta-lactamase domain-containing protein n=1 Tax=Rubricoccus marinus TaxID=716817 RepID=A0A259TWE9_9BACT|nr:MBL fold metallo-hydrolase [Rubricoccus marinus]OZC02073.1 hypothetical protein BSZ36_03185 [Rubricoccus marinus]
MTTPLSRRAALKGLGAFGVAAALPTAARAATSDTPPTAADHHTVSAHTFAVGGATVTVIRDAGFVLPLSAVGTNVAPEAVTALLESHGLPTDGVPTDVSVLLIRAGEETVLVDTGTGGGDLMGTMRALGIAPEAVTRVAISHFHGDHIGGLAPGGTPAFPNASVHFPAPEMAFLDAAAGDNEGASAAKAALQSASNVQTYADGDELVPGFTAVAAHGHTPGHMAFVLASGEARLMIVSDAVAHPAAFFAHPEWLFGFDMDAQAATTRRQLLGRAADERVHLFASHMPFPGIGRVGRDGGGFRFTPAPYAA